MTAATTRIVLVMGSSLRVGVAALGSARLRRGSRVDAEQLLAHQQDVGAGHRALGAQANEGAVRAADVREVHATVGAARDATMQTGDVAVLREQDVATLATAVHAALRNRERVAGGVAA